MNRLSKEKRAQIIGLLVEGSSLRAASRLADVSINTVTKLLVDAGRACSEYQDSALRNLTCKRIQVDEICAFCYAKKKNVTEEMPDGAGDLWTWVAIDADTKLCPSWRVGDRSSATAREFIGDLASRLANRFQLTSDGHKAYLTAVEEAFGIDIDFAMLDKIYRAAPGMPEGKYSPGECVGAKKKPIVGRPDKAHISTGYAERNNLTMRMSMRRFTRLTNAFSKKAENHAHAVALHFMWYNFGRIHKALDCSPAMAAGVTKTLWEISDIVRVIDEWEALRGLGQVQRENLAKAESYSN